MQEEGTDYGFMCMRDLHDLQLLVDKTLHRHDLIIEYTLKLRAVSLSAKTSST
jgi:hypothetical protein